MDRPRKSNILHHLYPLKIEQTDSRAFSNLPSTIEQIRLISLDEFKRLIIMSQPQLSKIMIQLLIKESNKYQQNNIQEMESVFPIPKSTTKFELATIKRFLIEYLNDISAKNIIQSMYQRRQKQEQNSIQSKLRRKSCDGNCQNISEKKRKASKERMKEEYVRMHPMMLDGSVNISQTLDQQFGVCRRCYSVSRLVCALSAELNSTKDLIILCSLILHSQLINPVQQSTLNLANFKRKTSV